ncbi:hypothetical protein MMH89_04290 [Candidatus Comchoanobacter bicostacola]|uniref:Uncharacterized protein n=1 Tax=Candidatus Comchoanobacter bicostacola TaxID=2919598 RepID=A0ABY5DKC7_9GAMM|nr:hypothetical protein [Candidatus Comchoanobacter bicostacola]UTC24437.1 hypothetical protein MMH89_04290 [Candidatus Comchoanobacter bicostacola]
MYIQMLTLILLSTSFALAQDTGGDNNTQVKILKEIRDNLEIDPSETMAVKTWGSANVSAKLDPFLGNPGDLISALVDTSSSSAETNIAFIQLTLDAILFDLEETSPMKSKSVTSYREVVDIRDRAKSCLSYWHAADPNRIDDPTSAPPLKMYVGTDKDLKAKLVSQPDKLGRFQCLATDNNKNSGYDVLTKDAKKLKISLEGKETLLTKEIEDSFKKIEKQLDPPKLEGDDAQKNTTAKAYIENIISALEPLENLLQLQVIKEINANPGVKKMPASSDIYRAHQYGLSQSVLRETVIAELNTLNTINGEATNLIFTEEKEVDSIALMKEVAKSMTGMGTVPLPFLRGLPNGGTEKEVKVLASGVRLTFKKSSGFWVASLPGNKRKVGLTHDVMTKIQSDRQSIRSSIEQSRKTLTDMAIQSFLKKTSSYGIIEDIINLRGNKQVYKGQGTEIQATPMEIIAHNSSWRLMASKTDSWMDSIATMDTANLLREIAVLQAQNLQMQYFIFAEQQKTNFLNAISNSSDDGSSNTAGATYMHVGTIDDFNSGVKGMSPFTPADISGTDLAQLAENTPSGNELLQGNPEPGSSGMGY